MMARIKLLFAGQWRPLKIYLAGLFVLVVMLVNLPEYQSAIPQVYFTIASIVSAVNGHNWKIWQMWVTGFAIFAATIFGSGLIATYVQPYFPIPNSLSLYLPLLPFVVFFSYYTIPLNQKNEKPAL